jgi:hypothetical protein
VIREIAVSFLWVASTAIGLASLVLLVIGFQKNNRKILLAAWICLLLAFVLEPAVESFSEGFAAGMDAARER